MLLLLAKCDIIFSNRRPGYFGACMSGARSFRFYFDVGHFNPLCRRLDYVSDKAQNSIHASFLDTDIDGFSSPGTSYANEGGRADRILIYTRFLSDDESNFANS